MGRMQAMVVTDIIDNDDMLQSKCIIVKTFHSVGYDMDRLQ